MIKSLLLSVFLVFLPPFAAAEMAAGEPEQKQYSAGTDYDLVSPALRTGDPERIEVTEFFWFGCGHCYSFEPMLNQWKLTLAEDVEFVAAPAVWNAVMKLHARAFYTAEVLGVAEAMNPAIYRAMNEDRKRLASENEIAALFSANGVADEHFRRAFNSFGVGSQVRQVDALARGAKITGTPSLLVNGKYYITAKKAGSQAGMLKVAEFLIEKERSAKSED